MEKKHDQQIYKISILPPGILLTQKNWLSLAYTGMYCYQKIFFAFYEQFLKKQKNKQEKSKN